jgi:hypothetical protein
MGAAPGLHKRWLETHVAHRFLPQTGSAGKRVGRAAITSPEEQAAMLYRGREVCLPVSGT